MFWLLLLVIGVGVFGFSCMVWYIRVGCWVVVCWLFC